MINDAVLSAWPVDRLATDLRLLVASVEEGKLGSAHLRLCLLADRGDSLAVQVVEGAVPAEPGAVLYVLGRGTFKLVRCERWPGGRVLLTLGSWPRR